MTKQQLAQELRQRQYKTGIVDRRLIGALTDDQMIESYITCSQCGKKQVTDKEIATALQFATNADQFFAVCDSYAGSHRH